MAGIDQLARVEEVLDAFGNGDLAAAATWLHPDIVVHEASSLPYGGTHHGMEGFLGMLTTLAESYTVVVHDHQLCNFQDAVILHQDMTFTSKSTGRSVSLPGIEIWRFTEDRISDIDAYYQDTAALVGITRTE